MADKEKPAEERPETGQPGGTEAPETARAERERGTPMTQQLGRIVLVAAAIIFAFFALANAQSVDFNWVFGSTDVETGGGVPLIVLLIVAFILGAVVGSVGMLRRKRSHRD